MASFYVYNNGNMVTLKFSNYIIILFLSVVLISCEKTKEEKLDDFVTHFNTSSQKVQNKTLKLMKSEKVSSDKVILHFSTPLSSETAEVSVIKASLIQLIGKMLWSNPNYKKLLNDGASFIVIVKGNDGKEILKEIVNKSGMTSNTIEEGVNAKHRELNRMLEVFNAGLPVVDSVSGVKITQIALGKDKDVIYTAVVPHKIEDAVKNPKAQSIIKSDMAKDQQLKKVYLDLKKFDVDVLKYQYRNDEGKLLQEVQMKEKDFK